MPDTPAPRYPRSVEALLDAVIHRLLADLVESGLPVRRAVERAAGGPDGVEVYLAVVPRGWPHIYEPDTVAPQAPAPAALDASPTAVRQPSTPAFSDLEEAILEVLGDGQILTGPKIAELAGYPYDTGIRNALAGLRRRGLLANHAPGYEFVRRPPDAS
jgi:hypothetical protein